MGKDSRLSVRVYSMYFQACILYIHMCTHYTHKHAHENTHTHILQHVLQEEEREGRGGRIYNKQLGVSGERLWIECKNLHMHHAPPYYTHFADCVPESITRWRDAKSDKFNTYIRYMYFVLHTYHVLVNNE